MSRSGPEAPTFRQEDTYLPVLYIYILYHIQLVDSYTLTLLVARLSSWLIDGLVPSVFPVNHLVFEFNRPQWSSVCDVVTPSSPRSMSPHHPLILMRASLCLFAFWPFGYPRVSQDFGMAAEPPEVSSRRNHLSSPLRGI